MTALLIDNLPLLAGAPSGIRKLRELILELAVRGKLVPQDPSDESATELLKRIEEGRTRLLTNGKKLKQQSEITQEEQPFPLPKGWSWVRLGSCLEMINGRAFKSTEWISSGLPIVRIQNLNKPDAPFNYCDPNSVDDRHVIDTGTLLISWSGTPGTSFGAFIWERGKAALNQHIFSCRKVGDVFFDKFLKLAINARLEELIAKAHGGVGLQHVTKGKLEALTLVLPPIAQQHRIVAKVDELMALCDRLEAQQTDSESAHTQLTQALLNSLTQASDASDFATNWQLLADHFHILFNNEPSIDALKQTLLQLAVMGKLVPQSPNEGSASELLRSIQLERQAAHIGKNKVGKLRSSDTDDEMPFELPAQWEWARLGELATSGPSNGYSPKPSPVETPYRCLSLSATTRGTFNDQCFKFVDIDADIASKYFLKNGDLLIQRANSIDHVGVTAIYEGTDDQFIFPDLMMRLRISDYLNPFFIHAYLSSVTGRTYFRNHASGTQGNMPKINQGTVVNSPIPIPPLLEQHRIVAKVRQLFAMCDQLKTLIVQASQLNERLTFALIESSLTEKDQRSPIAKDRQLARTLLAAEITHQLHGQRTFGQRKLQKVIYLSEHAAKLTAIQGDYLRNVAGPHDRLLMNQIEDELRKHQWYERVERDTVGYAYRPLSNAGQHQQSYESTWSSAERSIIKRVIELMRLWDTDRCEMIVTLYAAWNDYILEGRPASDEAIVDEVMHRWNEAKLRFSKSRWLEILADMKNSEILTPTGFGKRTTGGMLGLPFE